jgi:Putative adhesin
MKKLTLSILLISSLACYSQTSVEKTIVIKSGQKLMLSIDDGDIKLQTWDKNEILIKGTVSINNGENDSAFELQVGGSAGDVTITSAIRDKENIPRRVIIKKDGKEYFFKARDLHDAEVQKFFEENGKEYSYMSVGISKDIKLEIFIPRSTETNVQAKYGLIEIKNFAAPLTIESKYGGVDATLVAASTGEVIARSRYGEILTNLDIKFDQSGPVDKGNKWTEISAKLGKGPRYSFESKYGNVYLRKAN